MCREGISLSFALVVLHLHFRGQGLSVSDRSCWRLAGRVLTLEGMSPRALASRGVCAVSGYLPIMLPETCPPVSNMDRDAMRHQRTRSSSAPQQEHACMIPHYVSDPARCQCMHTPTWQYVQGKTHTQTHTHQEQPDQRPASFKTGGYQLGSRTDQAMPRFW